MKIVVTQEDIDNGKPHLPCHCPVALAVSRVANDNIWVSQKGIYLMDVTADLIVESRRQLPYSARKFIQNFDEGLDVLPFEFELEDF